MNRDTLIVVLSDLHSGGSTALFPNRYWQSRKTDHNHTPTQKQQAMYVHFEKCMDYALRERKGRRLIVVHDGDAIEGIHNNSTQVVTQNKDEQVELHIELMDLFLRKTRFSRKAGDMLYYISGTEIHTGEHEETIAQDLSAQKNPTGGHVFDHLELNVNSRILWFFHHGKKRGAGSNEGNALRNYLRDIFWDCIKQEKHPPDFAISGHTHTPAYNTYVIPYKDGFHTIHGIICPSWQEKTRFAFKVAPVERNEIGAVYIQISVTGEIQMPVFLKKETEIGRGVWL